MKAIKLAFWEIKIVIHHAMHCTYKQGQDVLRSQAKAAVEIEWEGSKHESKSKTGVDKWAGKIQERRQALQQVSLRVQLKTSMLIRATTSVWWLHTASSWNTSITPKVAIKHSLSIYMSFQKWFQNEECWVHFWKRLLVCKDVQIEIENKNFLKAFKS